MFSQETVKSSVPVEKETVKSRPGPGPPGVEHGNPDQRISKILPVESGILSFGTQRTIGIQNPKTKTDKDWNLVQPYLESGIHGVESRIHDCLERALDFRSVCRGFDSWDRTYTQGLLILCGTKCLRVLILFWLFMSFPAIRKSKFRQVKITANIFTAKNLLQSKYSLTYIKFATQKYCSITTCLYRLETKSYTMKCCMVLHRVRTP